MRADERNTTPRKIKRVASRCCVGLVGTHCPDILMPTICVLVTSLVTSASTDAIYHQIMQVASQKSSKKQVMHL